MAYKRENAIKLGASPAFADIAEAAEYARSSTDGQGADSTIVTTGVITGEHIAQAFAAIRKAGTVVIAGFGNPIEVGMPVSLSGADAVPEAHSRCDLRWLNPTYDIPRVPMYREGTLKLDELISRRLQPRRGSTGL